MVNSVTSTRALTDGVLRNTLKAVQPSATPPSAVTQAIALNPQEKALIQQKLDVATATEAIVQAVVDARVASSQPVNEAVRQEITDLVELEQAGYLHRVTQEFKGLPSIVRAGFAHSADNYRSTRETLFKDGYQNPAKTIFQKIKTAKFLDHSVVGGLHQEFVDRLDDLESELDKQAPGTATKVAAMIQQVVGFVPRLTRDSDAELSNHAYGLAIDIDSSRNPYIAKQAVINELNWVVRDLNFDFGKAIEPSISWGDAAAVTRLHEKVAAASDKLKAWLQQYLAPYNALKHQIEEAQQALKELDKQLKQAKAAQQAAQPNSDAHKQATAAIAQLQTEIKTQQEIVKTAETTIKADENFTHLQALDALHGKDLLEWSQYGIQSIPLELAIAMNALGFRWGQQYRDKKDGMHFELLAEEVISKAG
ncbi:M15 family metallopeptidase [Phormidium sp. FACHB-592]|uniref:M15 family metallopeptidase n=1 Tax=Stenomitos frigidus AS-A4 TaxID=2933935 RepID=A0ABV0KU57_9CYAN|nr:M15 family metallopeptidase [Phormidium sp. FACHB-592]MBD2077418.1 M15 family metallopeptidase [Phormidium sp. FACHB-592]